MAGALLTAGTLWVHYGGAPVLLGGVLSLVALAVRSPSLHNIGFLMAGGGTVVLVLTCILLITDTCAHGASTWRCPDEMYPSAMWLPGAVLFMSGIAVATLTAPRRNL